MWTGICLVIVRWHVAWYYNVMSNSSSTHLVLLIRLMARTFPSCSRPSDRPQRARKKFISLCPYVPDQDVAQASHTHRQEHKHRCEHSLGLRTELVNTHTRVDTNKNLLEQIHKLIHTSARAHTRTHKENWFNDYICMYPQECGIDKEWNKEGKNGGKKGTKERIDWMNEDKNECMFEWTND